MSRLVDDNHTKRVVSLQMLAIWHRDQTLAGINGVLIYLDDVLVMDSSHEDHDQRIELTVKRLTNNGFRLNLEKCTFAMPEVKFLRLRVGADGISANPEHTGAIANMPDSTKETKQRSLLGVVNHYGKFVSHLHSVKNNLEELTKKGVSWVWGPG